MPAGLAIVGVLAFIAGYSLYGKVSRAAVAILCMLSGILIAQAWSW